MRKLLFLGSILATPAFAQSLPVSPSTSALWCGTTLHGGRIPCAVPNAGTFGAVDMGLIGPTSTDVMSLNRTINTTKACRGPTWPMGVGGASQCLNSAGPATSHVTATLTAATALGSASLPVSSAIGIVPGMFVYDYDNNGLGQGGPEGNTSGVAVGSLLGVVSNVTGNVVTLANGVAYPTNSGDRIAFWNADTMTYWQGTATAAVSPSGTSVTLSGNPGTINGSAYAVDLDATNIVGQNTYGTYGISFQVTVSGNTATLAELATTPGSSLGFQINAGDRIAIVSGTGDVAAPYSGVGLEIGLVNQDPSAINVARAVRVACVSGSLGCKSWGDDTQVNSNYGAAGATLIGDELQVNNHGGDNGLSYAYGAFNNGDFRNGPAFQVGKGFEYPSAPNDGWNWGFIVQPQANVLLGDFTANSGGNETPFWDLSGSPPSSIAINATPTVSAFDYVPNVPGTGYVPRYRIEAQNGTSESAGCSETGYPTAATARQDAFRCYANADVPTGATYYMGQNHTYSASVPSGINAIGGGDINLQHAYMKAQVYCMTSGGANFETDLLQSYVNYAVSNGKQTPNLGTQPSGIVLTAGRDTTTGQPTITIANTTGSQYNCAATIDITNTY